MFQVFERSAPVAGLKWLGALAPDRKRQVIATTLDASTLLGDEGVNLVVVRRPELRARCGSFESFGDGHGAHLDLVLPANATCPRFECGAFGPVDAGVVRDDITSLVSALSRLSGGRRAKVTLGVVADDSCRRFHTDYVGFRAVVTYAGPGTEWVPDDAVVREHLGKPFASIAVANRNTVPDRRRVQRASPYDMVLMKGLAAKGNADGGLVHRSPPIQRKKRSRLVLVVTSPVPGRR